VTARQDHLSGECDAAQAQSRGKAFAGSYPNCEALPLQHLLGREGESACEIAADVARSLLLVVLCVQIEVHWSKELGDTWKRPPCGEAVAASSGGKSV